MKPARPYFQFGYNLKKLGFCFIIQENLQEDLIGYGYDIAPTLWSIKIHILFFHLKVGCLFINKKSHS